MILKSIIFTDVHDEGGPKNIIISQYRSNKASRKNFC